MSTIYRRALELLDDDGDPAEDVPQPSGSLGEYLLWLLVIAIGAAVLAAALK